MFDFDVRSGETAGDADRRCPAAAPGWREHDDDDLCQPLSRIPRRPLLVVEPSSPLREALRRMADRHAGAALVGSHGLLLGMLDERDVVLRLLESEAAEGGVPVWKVMAPASQTLLESDTVAYAVQKLWSRGGRAIPVLGAQGSPVGLLEIQDVVVWMCGRVGTEAPASACGAPMDKYKQFQIFKK